MTKKTIKNVSKTFLSSLVIFNLVFTTAAVPVVSLAFEERINTLPATQTTATQAEKGETEKETKGDKEDKGDKGEKGDPTKPDPTKKEEDGGGTPFNFARKEEVKGSETGPTCSESENMIQNGGFENPNITNQYGWAVFNEGAGTDWSVDWNGSFTGAPKNANIEIHHGVAGWTSFEGDQHAELDSDWGGPTDSMYGEEASTTISQTINTTPGTTYEISFAFSGRPNVGIDDNALNLEINGTSFGGVTLYQDMIGDNNTDWHVYTYTFVANTSSTTIEFSDVGDADSYGTLLDDVRVCGDDKGDMGGSINVCKVIVNSEGQVVDGTEFSNDSFTIPFTGTPDAVFTTPLQWNYKFGSDMQYDAQCVKASGLDLDTYTYGEEITAGPTNWTVTYTEGDINSPDGAYAFSADNIFSDGFIELGGENMIDTTLFVINKENAKVCPINVPVYARIKLTPQPYGWRNWGTGNTSEKIFVGGSDSQTNENGGDVYADKEWFMIHDGTNFVNDADIAAYRDVPGIALQRMDGAIRVALYGYLYEEYPPTLDGADIAKIEADRVGNSKIPNYYMRNRELSQFSIEFTTQTEFPSRSTTVIPVSQMSDPANPMDYTPGVHQYHPGSDNFRIISNLSQAHMLVTTGSDGFYTHYAKVVNDEGDCGGEEEKTGTLVVKKVIEGQGNGTFHFNGPMGTFDITTSNGSGSESISDLEEGTYSVTEIAMDGWEVVSSTCGSVTVVEDQTVECTIVNTLDDGNPGCEGNDCPGEGACESGAIWARFNIASFLNYGSGDVTSNAYLGSSGNMIAEGQWFMVFDGTNFINDADISTYEDVPGLAVQRMNGQVRIVLHGSGDSAPTYLETIDGSIEFFNGLVSAVSQDLSGNNMLEDGSGNSALDTVTLAGDHAYFDLQVDTNDDGFYVNYFYSLDEECDEDGDDEGPTIYVYDPACFTITGSLFDFAAYTDVVDNQDENLAITVDSSSVVYGTAGSYPVTYSATDSDGNTTTIIHNFVIQTECDGGEDGDPKIAVYKQACVDENATAYDFAAYAYAYDLEDDSNLTVTVDSSDVDFGTAGSYDVIYSATDSDGNTVTVTETFVISKDCDQNPNDYNPVITVTGQACVNLSVTAFDFAAGATATDVEDGNLTGSIAIDSSDVEFGTAGSYTVVYTVTDSDGNTTTLNRTFTIDADCDNGGNDEFPLIAIPQQSCVSISATSYDFAAGVNVSDAEDGNGTITAVIDDSAVQFGTAGTYDVIYSATDSDGNTTTTTVSFTIQTSCGNDDGGDAFPVITVLGQSCVSTGVLSYDFEAGASATDLEDGSVQVIIDYSAVQFGAAGVYDVTYSATDSDGHNTTVTVPFTISSDCGSGGGSDADPTINAPTACVLNSATEFDFLAGVTASDSEDGDLTSSIVVTGEENVVFGTNGAYDVTYEVTDSMAQTTSVTRTINISEDCDNGGGGGGGGGGGSSSGSRRNRGEVLGAETGCMQFTQYYDTGDVNTEVSALQTFLNGYMDAGLTVNGVYDVATTQAIHDFQAMHWDDVIDPWTPPLTPNTTGRFYKTTRMTVNAIIDCPEMPVYLEDPMIMYVITEVKDQKSFDEDQIEMVTELLATAQGTTFEK